MRLMIIGHARCGKDTVAEILRDEYGMQFQSSSAFALEAIVMPALARLGYVYTSPEDCQSQREMVPHWRKIWHDAILAYNTPDQAKLGQELFARFDIYVGCRNSAEYHALRNEGMFDYSIWVDAQDRGVPVEARTSNKLEPWMADFVLDNNHTIEALQWNTRKLMDRLLNGRQMPWETTTRQKSSR